MQTAPTQIAASIFASIKSRSSHAVFLCEQDAGPVLSFGANSTRAIRYLLHLQWNGLEVKRRTDDYQQFALLLDRGGPEGTLRLVFYDGVNPQPVIDYDGNGSGLTGHVLIQAHAERGDDAALLHAVFAASGESSLAIESNQDLCRHLTLVTAVQEGVSTNGLF